MVHSEPPRIPSLAALFLSLYNKEDSYFCREKMTNICYTDSTKNDKGGSPNEQQRDNHVYYG